MLNQLPGWGSNMVQINRCRRRIFDPTTVHCTIAMQDGMICARLKLDGNAATFVISFSPLQLLSF